jgi:hypothetical protein
MTDYLITVQRLETPGEPPVNCERRESEEVLAAMIRGTVEWQADRDDSWGDAQLKLGLRAQPYYVEIGNGDRCRCVARVSADHETSREIARVLRRKLGADSSRIIRLDLTTPAQSDRFEDELSEGMLPVEMWADHDIETTSQPGLPEVIHTALSDVAGRSSPLVRDADRAST